ncbi:adiponectin receptor protein 1-like [Polypterus senegalus]|uniref:adiponectin receptor protein 1-like n=1 Tax=Polypterus senegalus TaxID=55291 RepID=UPI0019662566|nr:adiponectin receptor protein 1-like [Polypterus senegalus]
MLGERSVDDLFVVALASAVLILMPLLQRHLNKPTALTSHVEPPEPKTGKRSTEESQTLQTHWKVIPFEMLPSWVKDNNFLHNGHRPPMPSFQACFRSIFLIHTETVNIWTHLIGFIVILVLGINYMFIPEINFVNPFQEKLAISLLFVGTGLCFLFSFMFHTFICHSERVSRIFNKLDYYGIAFMIVGCFLPWLYYSLYCSPVPQLLYLVVSCILGITTITVSQQDYFSKPKSRPLRAGLFLCFALGSVVPVIHVALVEGFFKAMTVGQLGWLCVMAICFLTGVVLYACRIPERFFPGRFDIWFHSHQIFHMLVVAGAVVHLHGISQLQEFRSSPEGGCNADAVL